MYGFKEVLVQNESGQSKVLVISFHDSEKRILEEFLMADASLLNYRVLEDIEKVLAGDVEEIKSSGNRCSLIIKKDTCYLEDLLEGLFDDFDTFPALEIPTVELKELILMWREKVEEFEQSSKNDEA